jgi:beta-glucosidase
MQLKHLLIGILICAAAVNQATPQQKPWIDLNGNQRMDVYENPDAEIDKRVNDLLSQMTVYEKMQILLTSSPAIPRLGIEKYYHGNEALHGVVRPGKFTVYPQAIALAATWNPDLIFNVASSISDEARARWNELEHGKKQTAEFSDLLAFWSPTINMARDPRWGRTPETYGEDPYLTSRIGVSFVKGLQGDDPRYLKAVSTPKHFAGNNEEHNRFECNDVMSERALRSYYLPAFRALVTEGKAQSIMTAYNAINGVPCTANKKLITDILRNEWGFNGYVVSDCGAPDFIYSAHHYAPSREDAAALAMKAGLDLECSGYCEDCFIYRDFLPKAYESGKITEAEINSAAFRVLRARFKLGIFDDLSLNPYNSIPPSVVGCQEHRDLALETARQSIVLLKNDDNILPLDKKKIRKIAVVGINANSCEFGDYSGVPFNPPVSPFEGIVNKLGKNAEIKTVLWSGVLSDCILVPASCLFHMAGDTVKPGLEAECFNNGELKGPTNVKTDKQVIFDPVSQPYHKNIPFSPMSVRWTGVLIPESTGDYKIGIKSNGNVKLYIDGKLVIDRWNWNQAQSIEMISIRLIAGNKYPVKVEFANSAGNPFISLLWKTPEMKSRELFAEEKKLARSSDVVVAVMGINKSIEMEGLDRTSIELPEDQVKFIQEIYKSNPKTVVVLVAGSSLAINWINENIPAIVNAWYPGEQGGNAIADVLFGDYNPAGRLPLTYYSSLDDLPPFNDYEVFNGRTYMYFEKTPLYPFGYGLSYSKFEYSGIRVNKDKIAAGDTVEISVNIKNTGKYNGDEVVQLYLHDLEASEKLPQKQLKAFKRVSLKTGETQTLTFKLGRDDLSFWNSDNEFILEPGLFSILIGASSGDIRQSVNFEVVRE